MTSIDDIFDHHAEFDPGADFEGFLKSVPGKWVVYLLADAQDQPIQLLCVRNLRASLKRRLGGQEMIGPTKKVNYREVVRRVHYRRVDSAFEADWVYYEAARQIFPESYRGLTSLRPAWFVHVNPEANFPRYIKTTELSRAAGQYIGPIEDKHAAARLIELVEDAFDLCRYYQILTQSPHGKACAYKQMHKCAAVCDGSISMEAFRILYQRSAQAIVDPQPLIDDLNQRMAAAAGELRFEVAGKIKTELTQLQQLGQGAYRHARRLEDFRYVTLQRGPWAGTAKLFLIGPGVIQEIAGLIAEPADWTELRRLIDAGAAARDLTDIGAECIGLMAHHLFGPKESAGAFIRVSAADDKTLAKRYRELLKQKPPETSEDEGIVRELQAM